ncbi:MAG: hypothetical protein EPN30_01555 [Actinomycetota bacterium]|nr:MAG: hypothetical protein EPN30_01555 [Actinomycetota bacterium]
MTVEAIPPKAESPKMATPGEEKFEWATKALKVAQASAGENAEPLGLAEPDGWRWRVLADLAGLRDSVACGYVHARDKQRSQAWESRVGPLVTGGGAGVGAAVAAVGAGIVKSGGWGWLLVIVGVLFAIVGSVFSANSYVRNRLQKLRYLRLLHDLGDYAYLVLPSAEPANVFQQIDTFRQLWESAGT